MTKHGEKSNQNSAPSILTDSLKGTLNQTSTAVRDFLENDPKAQATELGKQLAAEATAFIKANPWVSVLGAATIGYFLGSTRGGRK